jgi:hypothetical protein
LRNAWNKSRTPNRWEVHRVQYQYQLQTIEATKHSRLADILQARVVKQNLLHDEGRDSLGELASRLHDPQTQRDDLGL